MWSRRRFLHRTLPLLASPLLAGGVSGLVGASCSDSCARLRPSGSRRVAGGAQPNVVFISLDDLNSWVGYLGGHPQARTPHMDALAERSVAFHRAYVAAPVCNPSRTAVLTGRAPAGTGVYQNVHAWRLALPTAVTLPELFRAQGYDAVGFGKVFHFDDPTVWTHRREPPNRRALAQRTGLESARRAGLASWATWDIPDEQTDDGLIAHWAADYLGAAHDRPFFLAVGFRAPHLPWWIPAKYRALYPPESVTLPDVRSDDLKDIPPLGQKMANDIFTRETPPGNERMLVAAYLAAVSFADAQLGRVLDALDRGPHARSTIVIVWSDNGYHLGEKLHWHKMTLWEEATHVPCIINAPPLALKPGPCKRVVSLLDMYRTLCEVCGLSAPNGIEGRSLLPLLDNPAREWPYPAVMTYHRGNHSVRSERWRYIRYADGAEELYDHSADAHEWTNRVNEPEFAQAKKELSAFLPQVDAPDAPLIPSLARQARAADTGK